MTNQSPLEEQARKDCQNFLKQKALQYRRQATHHAYTNIQRYNELVREARTFDLCADLIYREEDD